MKTESSVSYLLQIFISQNMKLDQVDEAADTLFLANFYTIMFRKQIHVPLVSLLLYCCHCHTRVSWGKKC